VADYRVDFEDVKFVLRDQLDFGSITKSERYSGFTWDDFEAVLAASLEFTSKVIFPLQADCEVERPILKDGGVTLWPRYHQVYKKYNESQFGLLSVNPELGGQGMPHTLGAIALEFLVGACPSFTFVPGLAKAAANVIEHVGTAEQVGTYCAKMYSGEWGGTMCLTEPHAGSAVGDLKTRAQRRDGHYLISGSKIFISAGDSDLTSNVVHLVLARTEDAPPGIKGVSLFIVPKVRADGTFNDVRVTALEEKMGIHGSPTCQLSFGDDGDCHGYLLGGECTGIEHMFLMMNEARIAVGIQGVGIGNYAYQLALGYAKERVQGVDVGAMRDPNAPRVAIIEHPDVKRMLLTMKAYAEGLRSLLYSTASFYDRSLVATDAREKQRYEHLIEILTPICKAYGSYRGFDVVDTAILIHGGYGYCREYQVEGLLRDVKIAAIYEGTNGIQALDLLGRKVSRQGGMMFMTFIQWMNEFITANKEHPEHGALVVKLEAAKNTLAMLTMEFAQMNAKKDLYYPVLNASPYLELFGAVVLARLLIDQAVIASKKLAGDTTEKERRFLEAKKHTAAFFVHRELPKVDAYAAAIRSGDRSALEVVL
jgi:alkylation response protein AidB-like acyl-CoA dehydrogenase